MVLSSLKFVADEIENVRPLKIMLLFEFPTLNGGEHSMLSCLKQLNQTEASQRQFEFCAAGPAHGPLAKQLSDLDVPLTQFETHDPAGIKFSPAKLQDQMRSVLSSVNPHLVHSNSLSMSRNVGRMSDETFETMVRTGHLRDIIKLNRAAIDDLNRNDALIAVSDAARDFHVSRGLHAHRCQTIYNGVDTDLFAPADYQATSFQGLSELQNDAILVLNVGQICLRKGQLDLATAIVNLLPDNPRLHLILAGNRHSQKAESIQYEAAIHEAFSNVGMEDHLHCLGYQPNVQNLMNAADVLVHTAKQEPLGRALLEAAACELPIIATNVGGTAEILTDQETAVLVPPDTNCLQTALSRFLQDRGTAAAAAKTARNKIQSEFSITAAANRLAAFWQNQSCDSKTKRVS